MTLDYNKVWQVMNDLEELTPQLCTVRELIDYASESAASGDTVKSEYLCHASRELLVAYLDKWDERFKKAWNNTVLAMKDEELKDWREKVWQQETEQKWVLPVELDGPNGEYFVQFPDDLLEATNLKEGDQVEWIDSGDGSFELRKVEVQ